jgi:hypothetical protein
MLKIILVTLIVLLLMSFLALTPSRAFACTCFVQPFQDVFSSSTSVFEGRIIDINNLEENYSSEPLRVTFQILKVWKGPVENILIISTEHQTIACGFPFDEIAGDTYLVYAYEHEEQLWTHRCSRTNLLSRSGSDLLMLNIENHPLMVTFITIGTILIIASISLFTLRKK